MNPSGYLALVLHAHLPYVKHPEHEYSLEEDWLYQALIETYLPLVSLLRRLAVEGVPFQLTLVLSPTLIAMLDDNLLRRRFRRHLSNLDHLLGAERRRHSADPARSALVDFYVGRLTEAQQTWTSCSGDVVGALAALEADGYLDIVTCAATHAYLPLHKSSPQTVWAQLTVAVHHHQQRFGRRPTGCWLPECGYYEGLDEILAELGLRYFVVESHAFAGADPTAIFGPYAPVYCTRSGVAAFARDPRSAHQVWSRQHGYPADYAYREFHRDLSHDLPYETLADDYPLAGYPRVTGLKYHRITGKTTHKELYEPNNAAARAVEHAQHFVDEKRKQLAALSETPCPPLIVAPFDAELFGHWWYEGPTWLESVLRRLGRSNGSGLHTVHLRQYMHRHNTHQLAEPAESSWGRGGFHRTWLGQDTHWVYPALRDAGMRLCRLARRSNNVDTLTQRSLDQATRELLLAQASDWPFLIQADTMRDYAERRIRDSLARCQALISQVENDTIDVAFVDRVDQAPFLFPQLSYRVYR